jgi:hypothetical protein
MVDHDKNLPRRIEAVFQRTGLGNLDPEKLEAYVEEYEHAMSTADRVRARKGKKFDEILAVAPEATPEDKPE